MEKRALILAIWIIFLIFPKTSIAREKFVTIVDPVRGDDFWQLKSQKPLDFVSFQKKAFDNKKIKSTWLLRPDFLLNNNYSSFFLKKSFDKDDLGIFLEVTPAWAKAAKVKYNQGEGWSLAKSIFLSGYNQRERKRLIDVTFKTFKDTFGNYPRTIGAWHVDAYSAEYMHNVYGVEAVLVCADQFSTDGYRVWGGWWGVPFYPSKVNLLIPASDVNQKLDLVVLWWAARDPFNGYGSGVKDSTYSVQVNDYMTHNLGEKYFSQLASLYLNPLQGKFGQLTIGIENDSDLQKYGEPFISQINTLEKEGASFVTAREFGDWYRKRFPGLSPDHEIGGPDILGQDKEARWIMSTNKRVGLVKDGDGKWLVRDLRFYKPVWPDPYYGLRNLAGKLYWQVPSKVDTIEQKNGLQGWNPDEADNNSKGLPYQSGWVWILLVLIFLAGAVFVFRPPFLVLLLITGGGSLFASTMLRSGRLYDFGMGFWGPNGHDGIWHLSLMGQIAKKIPPGNPVFSGKNLSGYHWGFDFLAVEIGKIFGLSYLDVYFRLLPLLAAFLIGFLSFRLAVVLTKKNSVGFWFVFLNYFTGSFGWIVTWLRNGSIGGESLFWSMQSISTLINPPYGWSLVFLLLGLLIWVRVRGAHHWRQAVFLGILFGLTTGVKVYAGVLIGLGLFFYWLLSNKKRSKFDSVIWLTTAVVSFLVLFAMGVFSQKSPLVFKPFWFIHSLIDSIDKLYLPRLAVLRMNLSQNLISWKLPLLVAIEVFSLLLFTVGNMGIRVFAFWEMARRAVKNDFSEFDKLISIVLFFSFLFPLLFIQKGTTWNTIQFFYYFLFFANFYLAIFLSRLFKKRTPKAVFGGLFLVALSLPTTFSTLRGYFGRLPPAVAPYYELEGLNFLKKQKEGAVLTYPYNKFKKGGLGDPLPLYLYETTAYVSAFTAKQTFLEDEMNLEITGFSWRDREKEVDKFFSSKDKIWSRGFLLNNGVDYVYLVDEQILPMEANDLGLKMIFANGQVRIYKVLK